MSIDIEVEGKEIAIQNESGDIAIIPVKDVSRVKKMLKNPSELDNYVAGLPKMSEYAEDGTVVKNDTDNVKPTTPSIYNNSKLSDFIIDIDKPEILNEYTKKYSKIHKTSNPKRDVSGNVIPGKYDQPGCVAGALNCNTDLVAPKLGASPIRGMLHDKVKDIKNSKYAIPSKGYYMPDDFAPNQSIDAWEIGDVMVGEELGSYLFEKGNDTQYDKHSPNYPKGLDYSTIPLGAVILQGDAEGSYIPKGIKGKPRHMSTVVGFDKDGVPLTYDYGKIRRITNTIKPITKIVSPKGYEKYTYGQMKNDYDKELVDLGYNTKNENKEYNYKNESVNTIYKSLDKYDKQIGHDFNIPKNVMDILKDRVVGIGVKETNLNNTGDEDISFLREMAINLGDSFIGNKIAKPLIKGDPLLNIVKDSYNKLSSDYDYSKPEKHDWELEIEASKLANGDEELFKKLYNKARSTYPKPNSKPNNKEKNLKSSVGAFAIKNLPDYAKNKLKIDKSDLYGVTVGTQDEISKGSVAALTHLAENFVKLKKENKDLSNSELVDLATVAYNNNSKPKSKKFIEHYIKNGGKLSDGYLSSVKEFSEKYKK